MDYEDYTEEFDIDNRDIEREMYERDLMEEELMLNSEDEEVEEEQAEDDDITNASLTVKNLDKDLKIDQEFLRPIYKFSKDDNVYKGYVVHKLNPEKYIFNIIDSSENKLKAFTISTLKQIKK